MNEPNACVERWTTHQVASSRRTSPAQMAYCFKPFQESLPGLRPFQAATIA
jgi:hypothetical protein